MKFAKERLVIRTVLSSLASLLHSDAAAQAMFLDMEKSMDKDNWADNVSGVSVVYGWARTLGGEIVTASVRWEYLDKSPIWTQFEARSNGTWQPVMYRVYSEKGTFIDVPIGLRAAAPVGAR